MWCRIASSEREEIWIYIYADAERTKKMIKLVGLMASYAREISFRKWCMRVCVCYVRCVDGHAVAVSFHLVRLFFIICITFCKCKFNFISITYLAEIKRKQSALGRQRQPQHHNTPQRATHSRRRQLQMDGGEWEWDWGGGGWWVKHTAIAASTSITEDSWRKTPLKLKTNKQRGPHRAASSLKAKSASINENRINTRRRPPAAATAIADSDSELSQFSSIHNNFSVSLDVVHGARHSLRDTSACGCNVVKWNDAVRVCVRTKLQNFN